MGNSEGASQCDLLNGMVDTLSGLVPEGCLPLLRYRLSAFADAYGRRAALESLAAVRARIEENVVPAGSGGGDRRRALVECVNSVEAEMEKIK